MTTTLDHPGIRVGRHRSCWNGLRASVVRRILKAVARRVPIDLREPDGTSLSPEVRSGGVRPVLEIVRPEALYVRLADDPKVGIGEGYVAGDWRPADGTDLAAVLRPFAERLADALPPSLMKWRRIVDRPVLQRNSLSGARRNIEAHYDLSNEFFATFLDPTLSYSAARFDDTQPFAAQSLAVAQERKVEAILDVAGVRDGSSVLEIGSGWGTLAIAAARRGASVTTITLSREQASLAESRVREAGLEHLVEVRLQDYREVHGSYDAVVSVEMIEAVGEEYWPTYFSTLDRLLKPGGVVAIQAILMDDDRLRATRHSSGWIHKHIFPGGMIPSREAISRAATEHTALRIDRVEAFGTHYAETLRRWRASFYESTVEVDSLGFDEWFRRKWEFYLAYCEAGFDTGYLDVAQIRMVRPQDGEQA